MQKSTEICLILLIGVVMIFKYGKRFRFAPLFNNLIAGTSVYVSDVQVW